MRPIITCTTEGIYDITQGRSYPLLALDEENGRVKLRADNGRVRWFPVPYFDLHGDVSVPLLARWQFDQPVTDIATGGTEKDNLVEVSFMMTNHTRRWCFFVTPLYLQRLMQERSPEQGLYACHMIVARDLRVATVDSILREMDRQGSLLRHSLLLRDDTRRDLK